MKLSNARPHHLAMWKRSKCLQCVSCSSAPPSSSCHPSQTHLQELTRTTGGFLCHMTEFGQVETWLHSDIFNLVLRQTRIDSSFAHKATALSLFNLSFKISAFRQLLFNENVTWSSIHQSIFSPSLFSSKALTDGGRIAEEGHPILKLHNCSIVLHPSPWHLRQVTWFPCASLPLPYVKNPKQLNNNHINISPLSQKVYSLNQQVFKSKSHQLCGAQCMARWRINFWGNKAAGNKEVGTHRSSRNGTVKTAGQDHSLLDGWMFWLSSAGKWAFITLLWCHSHICLMQ